MTDSRKDHRDFNLAMALAPLEFPRDAAEIEAHVGTCESCREELTALRAFDAFLREHKEELSDVLSDCPTPDTLVDFASGERHQASVAAHMEYCPDCRELVDLVRDLYREGPVADEGPLADSEKAAIRRAVFNQCRSQGTTQPVRTIGFLDRVRALLHVPSLALGAAAAAVVVILLLPIGPQEQQAVPVFSSVTRQMPVSTLVGKGIPASDKATGTKKSVALVLVVSGTGGPTPAEVDDIYREVDVPRNLTVSFDFMAPAQVKAAAENRVGPDSMEALVLRLREALPADYLLVFRISASKGGYSINGRLLARSIHSQQPGASRTGIAKNRLASRISAMTADLLGEVDRQ